MNLEKTGLNQETFNSLKSVFQGASGVEDVILYGSRAKGNFKEGSDIDLVLVGKSLSTSDLLKIEVLIDDLLLPYKVDLCLFHQITEQSLLDHIKRVGFSIL